jgi:Na+/proline symporter
MRAIADRADRFLTCQILFLAYAGEHLLRDMPTANSIGDYVRWRFGSVAKTMCMLIVLFNMAIGLTAEYTTMGAVFTSYVGAGQAYPIIIVVSFLTLLYTAIGGLQASIITDQIQGIASLSLLLVISIYVAATFREPLPLPLPDEGCESMFMPCLGPSLLGWTTFFVYPVSLTAATFYSEAFWQRVWASDSKQTVVRGAWMATLIIIPVIFLFGFFGFLGVWSGLVTPETDYNVYMFQILNIGGNYSGENGMIGNAIGVLAVLLALVMNMSAG